MTEQDPTRPVSIAFAEFTALLLSETLDAVIDAQLEQEEKVRKLDQARQLTLEQFAQEFISLDDVNGVLAALFPSDVGIHGVLPGVPYQPETEESEENPPIFQLTGYRMQLGDWNRRSRETPISERGSENIRSHIHLQMASEQRANLLQTLHRGIPRVFVDHGRINAKLLFEMAVVPQQETAGSNDGIRASLAPIKATRISRYLQPALPYRLKVKTLDLRRPEETRLNVNIAGEVEITFKTITE